MKKIALVSTPWPLFNRPSIQLGALKAFVKEKHPCIPVDSHHIYLSIAAALGYNLYAKISESTWLAEPLYAALLYPDMADTIERFWQKRSGKLGVVEMPSCQELCHKIKRLCHNVITNLPPEKTLFIESAFCAVPLGQKPKFHPFRPRTNRHNLRHLGVVAHIKVHSCGFRQCAETSGCILVGR